MKSPPPYAALCNQGTLLSLIIATTMIFISVSTGSKQGQCGSDDGAEASTGRFLLYLPDTIKT